VDGLDLEDAGRVLTRGCNLRSHAKALAAEQDVSKPRFPDLGETGLLAEVERNVTHARLDLCEHECEVVVALVRDGIVRAELDEVVRLKRYNVREQVRSDSARFSMTRYSESSMYSTCGMGMYPTCKGDQG